MQLTALVVDHVSVELPPLTIDDGFALRLTVGAGNATEIRTTADALAEPPAPVQVSVNVLSTVSAADVNVPLVDFDPDHAPEAVHDVALVDDHVSNDVAPLRTEAGLATRVTVGTGGGGGAIETVADAAAFPPAPEHVKVNVLAEVIALVVNVPLVDFDPDHAPEAVHVVALVADQLRVVVAPLLTVCGLAEIMTVGADGVGGAGGADASAVAGLLLPPPPQPPNNNTDAAANMHNLLIKASLMRFDLQRVMASTSYL